MRRILSLPHDDASFRLIRYMINTSPNTFCYGIYIGVLPDRLVILGAFIYNQYLHRMLLL